MADQVEIPQLATELFEMSKGYLDQEVRAPLKRTGAYMKFSLIGGALFSLGWLFLSVAGLRSLQDVLPESDLFSVLAYAIAAAASIGTAGLLMWRASKTDGIK
jgi:hypothetical protein